MSLVPATWTFALDGAQFTTLMNSLRTAYQALANGMNEQAQGYAFASLPSNPVVGQRATCTDCNTTTFLANAAGSSTHIVPVMWNGTHWVVG